ncbi:MAG: 30S ribosomal protein S12 methylthiotransferase RimO [Candidatus Omnitrophica bacterium]|nr:30S ribosomal protein S12 methylthiotransferase RimO [Candidatus Omnitrophota bacterium]
MKRKLKVGILSLGCPRNLVDSENILGRLSAKGFEIVDLDKAEIGIVNTCAFIEEAKAESIDAILDLIELKKRGGLKKIIVYGCLAERYKEKLRKELPEVDAFVGRIALNSEVGDFSITPGHYAYLKICESCINRCSYCVIPGIKGKFTSLDTDSILRKVEFLDREKKIELNIIGQDITGYGLDLYGDFKLAELVGKIARKLNNIRWVRLLYLYPSRVSEELLEIIKNEPRVCKYIDLPVQHISGRILKAMNRKTAKRDILSTIARIRKVIPEAAIRTSVIVGFPGETDREFKELLEFVGEVKFDKLGAFIYSREEGTPACNLKGQVPKKIKEERFDALMLTQQGISAQNNRRFIGKNVEVLIDELEKDYFVGRTQYDAPEVDGVVYVRSAKKLKPGDLVKVNITGTLEYDLQGEV